jgi:IPT/TIG domain-containing protein
MALDTWDPRAAAAGMPIGLPALTSPYPQPPSPPNPAAYTDPVTRPAPTLTTVAPATMAATAAAPIVLTLTGTNFTNGTRVSFGGVVDHARLAEDPVYISPTSMKVGLDPTGLPAAGYAVLVKNVDGQTSGAQTFTIT